MKFEEKTLESEYIYKGRIISVRTDKVSLPNGRTADREVVEHAAGVCVVPLTDEGELVFVRQFRYPFYEELLELPAGKSDREGEKPLECGKRELLEETGATAKKFTSLGKIYPSVGFLDEVIHLFLAQDLSFGEQHPDEDEFLDIVRIPLEKAVEMVMADELPDAKTQVGILRAAMMFKKG